MLPSHVFRKWGTRLDFIYASAMRFFGSRPNRTTFGVGIDRFGRIEFGPLVDRGPCKFTSDKLTFVTNWFVNECIGDLSPIEKVVLPRNVDWFSGIASFGCRVEGERRIDACIRG